MRVAFYISGHGFGHASRQVEIMNALAVLRPDVEILLRTAVSPSLLARTVTPPFRLLEGPCDTGIIQRDSITHDDEATIRAAQAFYGAFPARVEHEVTRLHAEKVDVIVGDIPPLAFEVAARLGVPSIAIGNFTWDWIYEWYAELAETPGLLAGIRTAYRRAPAALELPMAGGFEVFPSVQRLPFVARHATRSRADTRRWLSVGGTQRLALLSFGGYGLPQFDPARLDCAGDWVVVTTDRTAAVERGAPAHVRYVSDSSLAGDGFRYEDIVAAVDVVVTKPGYGIIAESVAADAAMLYTSRGRFREYDVLVSQMPRYLRCEFLSQADLLAGRWREALERLLAQPAPPERAGTDGAEISAAEIVRRCPE